jgi:integrase
VGKEVKKLSARAVATVIRPGRHSDGAGLYLNVTRSGARSWLFIWRKDGRRREMGLGSAGSVSLARARELASACRAQVAAGLDPIKARDAALEINPEKPIFGAIADALIAAKKSEWRNEKHLAQWRVSLTEFAAPLRSRPVDEIDTAAVLAVLTPLWQTRPETASRVRGRIEAVLDAAKAQGHRSGENPAAWRGHLSHLLAKRQKLSRGHFAAMPYTEVPGFMAALRELEGMAAIALEFLILTAARSGEVLGTRWTEIDFEAKVWILPAARMKSAREHRVPLSGRALAILKKLGDATTSDYVFPSPQGRKPLSHMSMAKVMRRLQINRATVHGFRSAFRDWCGNETHFPRELAEAALAHVIGDKAEQAYRRSDALEKRRALMEAWAAYCEPKDTSNVIALGIRV